MRYSLVIITCFAAMILLSGCADNIGGQAPGKGKGGPGGPGGGGDKVETRCSDKIDNDGDGFCDYYEGRKTKCKDGSTPGDADCASKSDDSEAPQPVCGNNVIEGSEVCDGTDLAGATCQDFGFAGGTLGCNNCQYDTSQCTNAVCGNGIIEGSESCDGQNLGGYTCQDFGFAGGTLTCNSNCNLDTSSCTTCNPTAEVCDGLDNDCDGLVDEGNVCSNQTNSTGYCGDAVCDASESCSSCPSDCGTYFNGEFMCPE